MRKQLIRVLGPGCLVAVLSAVPGNAHYAYYPGDEFTSEVELSRVSLVIGNGTMPVPANEELPPADGIFVTSAERLRALMLGLENPGGTVQPLPALQPVPVPQPVGPQPEGPQPNEEALQPLPAPEQSTAPDAAAAASAQPSSRQSATLQLQGNPTAKSPHIAVVGSSGNLRGRGLGAAIDRASTIMRFNGAPTTGFELDVGSRTDVRVAHSWGAADALELGQTQEQMWLVPTTGPLVDDAGGGTYPISHAWVAALHGKYFEGMGSMWPSTGFIGVAIALALAVGLNRSVQLYGFGESPACPKYYNCPRDSVQTPIATKHGGMPPSGYGTNSYHPFESEAKLRAIWAQQGAVETFSARAMAWAARQTHVLARSTDQ